MKDHDSFERLVDALLHIHGRKFRGIRLRCRKCQEKALAATPEIARTFGWSNLTRTKGPNYTGLCLACGKLPRT